MIPLRDENPTRSLSFMTVILILINSIIYIYELSLGNLLEIVTQQFAIIPYNFINYFDYSQFLTLFTAMFLHGDLLHLLGNMLYLWVFGNNVEDVLGHFKFLLFYLLCGIFSSIVHILINPQSTIPTLGASGAISGVLGAYFILFPHARIIALFPWFYYFRIVKVSAFYFLGFWIFIQILSGLFSLGIRYSLKGGIAWFAHIGGFFGGVLFLPLFIRFRKRY